jgi:hypothetical protein
MACESSAQTAIAREKSSRIDIPQPLSKWLAEFETRAQQVKKVDVLRQDDADAAKLLFEKGDIAAFGTECERACFKQRCASEHR